LDWDESEIEKLKEYARFTGFNLPEWSDDILSGWRKYNRKYLDYYAIRGELSELGAMGAYLGIYKGII
jgi:hypothetical protein